MTAHGFLANLCAIDDIANATWDMNPLIQAPCLARPRAMVVGSFDHWSMHMLREVQLINGHIISYNYRSDIRTNNDCSPAETN